jgi:glycosyltransferase involved in cell wall biosynthesis
MRLAFLCPERPAPGGGRDFLAGIVPALRARGHDVTEHGRDGAWPEGALPVIDGMALPALEPEIESLIARDAVLVVHHVAAAAGRDAAGREAVLAAERRMIPRLRRVVATSEPVAKRLEEAFGATARVLQPGMPDLPRSAGSGGPGCAILSAGVLTPRKGHDRLLRALARLTDLDWTLTIAGDAQRDPAHARTIEAEIEAQGLAGRVTLLRDPAAEAMEAAWRGADLFALATSWEGWPAGVAEALRRGLPAVAANVGGVGALLPMAAGIAYAADDAATFGKCLRRAIFDTGLRRAMAESAWQAGQRLPGWPQQAETFETILRG